MGIMENAPDATVKNQALTAIQASYTERFKLNQK